MARVKKGVTAHARHKKILKLAKGYRGTRSRLFKKANETVMKALYYARRDRRAKKREFRQLWIARITQRPASMAQLTAVSSLVWLKQALKLTVKCWLTWQLTMQQHSLNLLK